MGSEIRSREERDRAEAALVWFALLAGEHALDFVVIGGLNPDFLAPVAPVPHQGTTDVDLLFEIGFIYDRDEYDFAWLDRALESGGFERRTSLGWQWDATVGDSRIRLDLLCDVPDNPGQTIALPGATRASTQNLVGPAPALLEPVVRTLTVPPSVRADHPDAPGEVTLRFANLGGYLLAKAAAHDSRGLPKDAYDLMFVTLYNPGGSTAAAVAVENQLALLANTSSARQCIRNAMGSFLAATEPSVGIFATEMRRAGDESTEEQLRTDAVIAAQTFLAALHVAADE